MSNLLKEAIVDAKALKDAALKNAEAEIIEKYSVEVRDVLDRLLEQDNPLAGAPMEADPLAADLEMGGLEGSDPAMMVDDELAPEGEGEEIVSDTDVPLAAADVIPGASEVEGEPVEFDLDLSALQEAITELQGKMDTGDEVELTEGDIRNALSEEIEFVLEEDDEVIEEDDDAEIIEEDDEETAEAASPSTDGVTINVNAPAAPEASMAAGMANENMDALVDSIVEKLTVDMGADLSGWAGRSSEDMMYQMEKELAHRRSTDVEEELKDLKKAQEELVFENKQLKEQNEQYKQATNELKEGLQDVNLSNARLLYTNRVLRNTSLNERQKERIVEAISEAGSVTEARTIFDTLQSTVEARPKKSPQSLSEAITRNRSSVIRASRSEKPSSDPFQDRMKRLAGIK
mgnify:CR=1 FL=1|tara:strand:+ start:296 stop:1507 length:1212 start_codon:yes stop_codon:yes gene_type:complete